MGRGNVDLQLFSHQLNANKAPTARDFESDLTHRDESELIFGDKMTRMNLSNLQDGGMDTIDFARLREFIDSASIPAVKESIMGLLSEKEATQFQEWLIK